MGMKWSEEDPREIIRREYPPREGEVYLIVKIDEKWDIYELRRGDEVIELRYNGLLNRIFPIDE